AKIALAERRKNSAEELVYFPRHLLMDRSSRRPAAAFLRDRAESTDLFVEGDQILAELLEAVKLGHLLLRLAQRCAIGNALRYRLARDSASAWKLRIMSGALVFRAVAGRLSAASDPCGPGRRSKITAAAYR